MDLFITVGDCSIESSENSSISGVSWISDLVAGVRLGRAGSSSMVRSMVGCGVILVVVSVVVGSCSGGVSATMVREFSSTMTGKLAPFGWPVAVV